MTADHPITGAVHSIETMGAVDGPGLRTVVFLQGCPLKCAFCHNIDCSIPSGGTYYTVDALVEEILKNRAYWKTYGSPATDDAAVPVQGGVTFSGGEPTMQHSFLINLLQQLKEEGVHTAIDSCSVTSPEVVRSLVPYIDLFMLSIKHMDDEKHLWLTGASNRQTLSNIRMLDAELSDWNKDHTDQLSKQIRVRFLVIPGITDQPEHLRALGEFVQELNNLEVLEILAYGTHGKHKWIELFGKYDLDGVRDATRDDLVKAAAVLEPFELPLKYA